MGTRRTLDLERAQRAPAAWQCHRFGDTVAAYLGTGETVYLTPQAARRLAAALNGCARDVTARPFLDSQFETRTGRTA